MSVLTRLTLVITDSVQFRLLSNVEAQAYDIIAVRPTTERLFMQACESTLVDVICFDLTEKLPFYLKRPAINVALSKGIFFEVDYSPCVRHSATRSNTIRNVLSLVHAGAAKNLIFSSGCEFPSEMRGPYDVASLGYLFGLTQAQGKCAVGRNCHAVILHAKTRKTTKGVLLVTASQPTAKRKLSESASDSESDNKVQKQ